MDVIALSRFITALGLGGAIPTALALASEYASGRRRELAAAFVTVTIVVGGTLGGIRGRPNSAGLGMARAVRAVLGAVPPLLLAVALALWLPGTRLARTGNSALPDLPWPAYGNGQRQTMRFGHRVGVVGDLAGAGTRM